MIKRDPNTGAILIDGKEVSEEDAAAAAMLEEGKKYLPPVFNTADPLTNSVNPVFEVATDCEFALICTFRRWFNGILLEEAAMPEGPTVIGMSMDEVFVRFLNFMALMIAHQEEGEGA